MYEGVFADIRKDANAQLNTLKPPFDEIAAILSRRFRELIESKNGHDVYYAATFLHPGTVHENNCRCSFHTYPYLICFLTAYRDSNILKRPNPLSTSISIDTRSIPGMPGAPNCKVNPSSYFRVRDYLYSFLISLRKSGKCPTLNNLTPDKMANEFKESFGLYARGMWPFNGWTSAIPLLEWWKHIGEAYPHTGVLVVSALALVFLYLIC